MPSRSNKLFQEDIFERPATPRSLDFTNVREVFIARDERGLMRNVNRAGIPLEKGISTEQTTFEEPLKNSPGIGLASNTKQARARARRRMQRGVKIADEAWNRLYKPVDEWDVEELARGRPRNIDGKFSGPSPQFISRELHERALERFKIMVREGMNTQTISALQTLELVMNSDEYDVKGRPIVPASTKVDVAKFLIEHLVGKPTQPTTSDISVKLQGILGTVMVNPGDSPGSYVRAHVGSRELTGAVYDAEEDEEDE